MPINMCIQDFLVYCNTAHGHCMAQVMPCWLQFIIVRTNVFSSRWIYCLNGIDSKLHLSKI